MKYITMVAKLGRKCKGSFLDELAQDMEIANFEDEINPTIKNNKI